MSNNFFHVDELVQSVFFKFSHEYLIWRIASLFLIFTPQNALKK